MLAKLSVATLAMLVMPGALGPIHAGDIETTSCVESYGAFSCITVWRRAANPYIRTVSAPANAQEEAEVAERDRLWVARCRPIIKQDRYGVSRYHYAASGCEFGVIQGHIVQ
jgi:hypothetical protein